MDPISTSPAVADSQAGRLLPWPIRFISWLLRTLYFGRVRITGTRHAPCARRGGRLIIASHRNGAIDGYQVLRAFPGVQFLTSVQLLRQPLLRLMFAGIPVVRDKDRERYGFRRSAYGNPVDAGCAHLLAGGDLALFPEGSSQWGPHPLPYQRGAARIARRLLQAGLDLEVVPVGLFYTMPDRFRSHVEVYVGKAVTLPPREEADSREWEQRLHAAMSAALDAVSVNCPDQTDFAAAQAAARQGVRRGKSYAESLLAYQRGEITAAASPGALSPMPYRRWFGLLAMAAFAPVLIAAWWAGRKADARNTVTFFRMAGGLAAGMIWTPLLLFATLWNPLVLGPLWLLAGFGWWWLGRGEDT